MQLSIGSPDNTSGKGTKVKGGSINDEKRKASSYVLNHSRTGILCGIAEASISQLTTLCQSIGLALISIIHQDDTNVMNLTNEDRAIPPSNLILRASYSPEQIELHHMLHHSLMALTIMLDFVLVGVLEYSYIETSPLRILQRETEYGFLRWRLPKRLGHSMVQSTLERRHRQINILHPHSKLVDSSPAVNQRRISDTLVRAMCHQERIIQPSQINSNISICLRRYSYPHLITLVEHVMISGSGLGINSDGIWNSGLLLRLAISQLLNSHIPLAISALTQCLFIAEVFNT